MNIVTDMKRMGVHITDAEVDDSRVFTVTSKIHKNSPFTHPITYSLDYDLDEAYNEVASEWAVRLGYEYRTVFGASQ